MTSTRKKARKRAADQKAAAVQTGRERFHVTIERIMECVDDLVRARVSDTLTDEEEALRDVLAEELERVAGEMVD